MNECSFSIEEYIPFLLQGTTPEDIKKFFEGPVAKPGDRVEFYCFAATDTKILLKWRVVSDEAGLHDRENPKVLPPLPQADAE